MSDPHLTGIAKRADEELRDILGRHYDSRIAKRLRQVQDAAYEEGRTKGQFEGREERIEAEKRRAIHAEALEGTVERVMRLLDILSYDIPIPVLDELARLAPLGTKRSTRFEDMARFLLRELSADQVHSLTQQVEAERRAARSQTQTTVHQHARRSSGSSDFLTGAAIGWFLGGG